MNKKRERIYTSEMTLWAFLSQTIESDKSQQAAVSRIVATAIANGEAAPSVNTSAFSQARSNIKETMSMDILRGKTPSMVRKEIWVHLLAYNLIRKWMAQAAWDTGKAVSTLSLNSPSSCSESLSLWR